MRYLAPVHASLPQPAAAGEPVAASSTSFLAAGMRIVWDTALYRVRRHEAGNLIATASLLIARGAGVADLALRVGFAALLNLLAYLLNDLCDVDADLAAGTKDRRKTEFLRDHRGAALAVLAALFLVLLGVALWHSALLVVALVASVAIVGAYSLRLKSVPVVDLVLAAAGGFSMTLVGVRRADLRTSLLLAGFLGLVSACFQAIQVTRDRPADLAAGLRTSAVALGPRGIVWAFRLLALATAAYGVLALGRFAPLVVVAAVLLPLDEARATRSWDLARLLFGLAWIGLLLGV